MIRYASRLARIERTARDRAWQTPAIGTKAWSESYDMADDTALEVAS